MDKFRTFIKNKFLAVESILYTDRTLFRKLITEAAPSDEELTKLDIELSDPENAKKYLNNEKEIVNKAEQKMANLRKRYGSQASKN